MKSSVEHDTEEGFSLSESHGYVSRRQFRRHEMPKQGEMLAQSKAAGYSYCGFTGRLLACTRQSVRGISSAATSLRRSIWSRMADRS